MEMNAHDRSRVSLRVQNVSRSTATVNSAPYKQTTVETTILRSTTVNYGGEARVARRINANNGQVERAIEPR